MAPRTDLSWLEFNNAAGKEIAILKDEDPEPDVSRNFVYLDISTLVGVYVQDLTEGYVIKALTKALEIARSAQEQLNQGKPNGERMAAFPAPVVGNPVNGFVPITRSIASRLDLGSATVVVGNVS